MSMVIIAVFSMNPLTQIKNQNKLNERELSLGIAGDDKRSWHQKYKDSAWIYIGGLPYDLSEGDVITIFSQYGEVMNINLVRDQKTGKSKGFAFLCYQDQRSTNLAVDNFNGAMVLKRTLKVDHVEEYKLPKYREDADEATKRLWEKGCAPEPIRKPSIDDREIKRRRKEAEEEADTLISLKMTDDMKNFKKQVKKEQKKLKRDKEKREKKIKKLKKLLKRAREDPAGPWNAKAIKYMDDLNLTEEELYGVNDNFDFGKKKESNIRTHNMRPDFEKADWRDVEIWKAIREREKEEEGESKSEFPTDDHYVAARYQ